MESQVEIDLKTLSQNKNGKDNEECTESRVRKRIEIAVLCLAIVLLLGLVSLPGVFRNINLSNGAEDDVIMMSLNESSNENTSFCIPEVYTGSVCRTALQTLQTCLFGDESGEVLVPADRNQDELETAVQTLIGGLPLLNPSEECSEVAPPFLCFSMFGLCNNQSRERCLPSSPECRMITEEICAEEFVAAGAIVGSDQLPQCDEFPDVPETQECTVNSTGAGTLGPMRCSDGFYLDGICRPECGVWEAFSYGTYIPLDVTVIIAASVFFISAPILLIFSCIRYRYVLKFPSIFIVYGTIALGVLEFSFLMGFFDRKTLFCNSRDLVESFQHPTPFCMFQGIVYIYCILLLTIFSFLHILSVFWGVMFLFHARLFKVKGYLKYVHLTMLSLALILPWGTISVAFSKGAYKRFPPITCFPDSKLILLYGMTWPICVMLAISLSLTVIMLFVIIQLLRKKRQQYGVKSFKALLSSQLLMSTAELKILITFIYYALINGSLLAFSAVGNLGGGFFEELFIYLSCESTGIMLGKVRCERAFQRLELKIPLTAGLI